MESYPRGLPVLAGSPYLTREAPPVIPIESYTPPPDAGSRPARTDRRSDSLTWTFRLRDIPPSFGEGGLTSHFEVNTVSNETQTLDHPGAVGVVAPAGPVPTAVPSPVPMAIPDDLEPAAAALALLQACRPDAAAVLSARIEAIAAELERLIEAARLNTAEPLARFLATVGRLVKLRQTLQARAGQPAGRSPAAEVLDLVRSVRRWRPATELRSERARVIDGIRAELAEVEQGLSAECSSFASGNKLSIGGEGLHHRTTGLVHEHDEFLRRAEELLKARATLRGRMAALDGTGDGGRAAMVRSEIDRTGGVDALVDALAPTMTVQAAADLALVRRAAADLTRQLSQIDPETKNAAAMTERRQGLDSRATELEGLVKKQQAASAAGIVAAALTGKLAAVMALETACASIRPALAEACVSVRAGETDLVATIAEMIGQA